ncbi:MAG: metallophosphoesterase [Bacteroidales bacterium]
MKKIKIDYTFFIVLFAVSLVSCESQVQESNKDLVPPLHFNREHKFKIAQFTDIHWKGDETEECSKTTELIQYILKTEKPDLAVLTGDIVNYPSEEGWKTVMSIFTASEIPFAVTLGNHDDEADWSRDKIFDYLETLPGFVGKKGPANISGVGNYILEIRSADSGKNAALLYFFDSHSYPSDRIMSDYDWIKFDQIAWHREQSKNYTSVNGGNPYPALAFFHIPIPEYSEIKEQPTTLGERNEKVCSPRVNSGLFTSFMEMKDVMSSFAGHDHNNNYIGIHKGVALAYGQSSGYSGYGKIGKGARIIELQEGKYGFNTWIRFLDKTSLYYNYPLGCSFRAEDYNFLPSVQVENIEKGIFYKYFEGEYTSVSEMPLAHPRKQGTSNNVTLEIAGETNSFGLEFSGLIKITATGIYRFYTTSDDGSQLYIDDKLVVDNDGAHGVIKADGLAALNEGYHNLKVLYFNAKKKKLLNVSFMSLDFNEKKLPDSILYYAKSDK